MRACRKIRALVTTRSENSFRRSASVRLRSKRISNVAAAFSNAASPKDADVFGLEGPKLKLRAPLGCCRIKGGLQDVRILSNEVPIKEGEDTVKAAIVAASDLSVEELVVSEVVLFEYLLDGEQLKDRVRRPAGKDSLPTVKDCIENRHVIAVKSELQPFSCARLHRGRLLAHQHRGITTAASLVRMSI